MTSGVAAPPAVITEFADHVAVSDPFNPMAVSAMLGPLPIGPAKIATEPGATFSAMSAIAMVPVVFAKPWYANDVKSTTIALSKPGAGAALAIVNEPKNWLLKVLGAPP